jgi:hypothetical protein
MASYKVHIIPSSAQISKTCPSKSEILELLASLPNLEFKDVILWNDNTILGVYLPELTADDATITDEVKEQLIQTEPRLLWKNPHPKGELSDTARCYTDRFVVTPNGNRAYQLLVKQFDSLVWINQLNSETYLNPKFEKTS